MVPPGQYQVRLTAGGHTLTQPIVVKKDARLTKVSDADLAAPFSFATELGAAFSQASDMVVRIRRLKPRSRHTSIDDMEVICLDIHPCR
jgi:hypothetical protein